MRTTRPLTISSSWVSMTRNRVASYLKNSILTFALVTTCISCGGACFLFTLYVQHKEPFHYIALIAGCCAGEKAFRAVILLLEIIKHREFTCRTRQALLAAQQESTATVFKYAFKSHSPIFVVRVFAILQHVLLTSEGSLFLAWTLSMFCATYALANARDLSRKSQIIAKSFCFLIGAAQSGLDMIAYQNISQVGYLILRNGFCMARVRVTDSNGVDLTSLLMASILLSLVFIRVMVIRNQQRMTSRTVRGETRRSVGGSLLSFGTHSPHLHGVPSNGYIIARHILVFGLLT